MVPQADSTRVKWVVLKAHGRRLVGKGLCQFRIQVCDEKMSLPKIMECEWDEMGENILIPDV